MPFILKKYHSPRKILFFLGEGALIFLSLCAVYLIVKGPGIFLDTFYLYGIRIILVTVIFQLSFYYLDLYDLDEIQGPHDVTARLLQAIGLSCILLAIIYYISPVYNIPSRIFWPGLAAICICIFFWRYLYNHVLNKKMFAQNIIVLGTGQMAKNIAEEINNKRDSGFAIVHFVGKKYPSIGLPPSIPLTEDVKKLPQLCRKYNIERVISAMDDRRGTTPVQELITCKFMGFPIEYGIRFYERLTGKILIEKMNPDWIIFSSGFKKGRLLSFYKRALDIFLALFGLIVTLPFTLMSALIIKLESPGDIFYAQERVGEHGRRFKLIKFRSMQSDAEKNGPVWAMKDDTRVTRFGKFIRKTRIDELPQMFNVLMGDMSFVGPRPERPVFVDQLTEKIPYYSIRHNIKPGITGWAQISYPYGASEEDALRKLEYDMYYIKYMSIQMDISIIFQTIKTVLFQKGAR